jgi:hypothetical protein
MKSLIISSSNYGNNKIITILNWFLEYKEVKQEQRFENAPKVFFLSTENTKKIIFVSFTS